MEGDSIFRFPPITIYINMKKQEKQIEFGFIIDLYSKHKTEFKVATIYLGWANQIKLSRQQPYNPQHSAIKYLTDAYPIQDLNNTSQCHRSHPQVRTIFDVFKLGGCHVNFLSEEQGERKKLENDPSKLQKYYQLEEANRIGFLQEYGIGNEIMDYVGVGRRQIIVFRDKKYWYRLDTERFWAA